MNNKIKIPVIILSVLFIAGCAKDSTLIVKLKDEVVTKTVYFNKDLVPLFTANCAVSGCHNAGGKAPDLTAAKAYTSLMNGKYIDTSVPENSKLYKFLTGALSPAMPMGKPTNPGGLNALTLAWIKQGAKKN